MAHELAKTILICKVIELLAEKKKITIGHARDLLYRSDFIHLIEDDESGLYGESPLRVLSLYLEQEENK